MERIAIHVPRNLHDGSRVPQSRLDEYDVELLDIAEAAGESGFTTADVTGTWRFRSTGTIVREPFIRYELDVADAEMIRDRVAFLAERIRVELDQEAVYVTTSAIDVQLISEFVPA